jgi:glycerophosphoryl diester phosphodiesterase
MSRLPLIIGHRGASFYAPENTLAALKMAIEEGADGVEFDVRLAKDGIPVVIHDADLRRVARRGDAVSDLTSTQLAGIDVGSWFDRDFTGRVSASHEKETVPSLERVLNLLEDSSRLVYVEIKTETGNTDELVQKCCAIIRSSPLLPRIIVKSFSLEAIKLVKELLPEVQTAALFEPNPKTVFRRGSNLVGKAADHGARHISLHWSLVNRRLLEAANSVEMPVTVWTVDHPRWVERAQTLGIRSLITNDPKKLIGIRDGSPGAR